MAITVEIKHGALKIGNAYYPLGGIVNTDVRKLDSSPDVEWRCLLIGVAIFATLWFSIMAYNQHTAGGESGTLLAAQVLGAPLVGIMSFLFSHLFFKPRHGYFLWTAGGSGAVLRGTDERELIEFSARVMEAQWHSSAVQTNYYLPHSTDARHSKGVIFGAKGQQFNNFDS